MGTRADFYIGRGENAKWIGSVAWDGYPDGIDPSIMNAASEEGFSMAVASFIESRDDGTNPEMGWPWPWDNSWRTDYSYAWDNGVWHTVGFDPKRWLEYPYNGPPLFDEDGEPHESEYDKLEIATFPDMSAIKKVTLGKRSGVIIL